MKLNEKEYNEFKAEEIKNFEEMIKLKTLKDKLLEEGFTSTHEFFGNYEILERGNERLLYDTETKTVYLKYLFKEELKK